MPKPRVPFGPEIVDRIWKGLEAGRGLRRLCREPGMPTRATVMRWLKEKPGFADDIALARLIGGLERVGLLHGGLQDQRMWAEVMPPLAKPRRVIRFTGARATA